MTTINETRLTSLACCSCNNLFQFSEDSATRIVENSHRYTTERENWADVWIVDSWMFFCNECFSWCTDCGDPVENDNLYGSRCEDCDSNYSTCHHCGDQFHDDVLYYVEEISEMTCQNCVANSNNFLRCPDSNNIYVADSDHWLDCEPVTVFGARPARRLVENYSFKPNPNFFQLPSETTETFFGVELEIEAPNGSTSSEIYDAGAKLIKDTLKDLVYLKQDGSLNYGFEIVTHPFTFEWYKANLKTDFMRELSGMGFKSWDAKTCGIHVHISRKAFKDSAHVWRFVQLFLKNKTEWVKLAGRNSKRWSSFDPDRLPILDILKKKKNPERYCAVNLCNYDTLEIRIFRGSLNETRFRSAIELVAGAVDYTRMITLKDYARHAIEFENFAKFLNLYADEYPNANQILTKKGLI